MGFHSKSFRFEGGGRQHIGLKRTGKSCRLRWVNYLHPGLKRGKMTPQEEKLVLELHSKLGNRWSRIARKLPGRTDNEIKNYWRTHMRKKAQEKKKKVMSPSLSSSSSSNCPNSEFSPVTEIKERSFYDTGGIDFPVDSGKKKTGLEVEESTKVYSLDDIWEDLDFYEESCNLSCQTVASPIWDYRQTISLWPMDDEESKMLMQPTMGDDPYFNSFPFYNHMIG